MTDLNLHLGAYKTQDIRIFGQGFDKVNLITGMKGGGKSHIAKGIITENLKAGMSSVVFDINGEYSQIPNGRALLPGENTKCRLDYTSDETLFRIIERLNPPFAQTATASIAFSKLPSILKARRELIENGRSRVPDMAFLKGVDSQIVSGNSPAEMNMKYAYIRAMEVIESSKLIMSEQEAQAEDTFIEGCKRKTPSEPPSVMSLRAAFTNIFSGQAQALSFQIGGLPTLIQKTVVSLVIDHLKKTCEKQTKNFLKGNSPFPVYPTVFFEEAHMYMDERDIDELIPLIRHIGINVFFVTNTPGALPDSIFRLLDNLIMTRMVNRKDIDRVADCGLIDKETIVGFAKNLKDRHALFLSAKDGATKGFPLVMKVRENFGLPKSGQTRSQWEAMKAAKHSHQENTSIQESELDEPEAQETHS